MREMALLLEASPGRLEFALRLSLIAALTTYVIQYYQTPEAALTVYLIFFMNKTDRTSSILQQCVMMLLMTLIIATVVLLAMAIMDSPFCRVLSMVMFSIAFLFLASSSKLKPIGGTLALVIGYSLDLLGSAPSGELALRGLLYGWLIVVMAALTSMIVNLTIAPAPATVILRTLKERLKVVLRCLDAPSPNTWATLERLREEGNDPILKYLKLASLEQTLSGSSSARLRMLAEVSFEWMTLLSLVSFRDTDRIKRLNQRFRRPLESWSYALVLEKIETTVDAVPSGDVGTLDPLDQLMGEKMASGFDRLCNENPQVAPAEPEKSERHPFFLPDAFTNPDHVHYALKTTAAAMLCYLAYTLMDWPGIHTCFITCYIVSLGTAGESVEKLRLRLLGCLFGAILGVAVMLTIIPWIDGIESLLLIVTLGTFLAAWVAGGSPRIAYAGFQIAFAFYLCVIQGTSPEFDLAVARDRVIGVLLGNVIAFAMTTEVWPVSMGRQLDLQLKQLILGLKDMVNHASVRPWSETGPRLHAQASQLRERLGLASLEPVAIRPTDRALAACLDIANLASRLNDAVLLDALPESLEISAALERLHQLLRESTPVRENPSSVEGAPPQASTAGEVEFLIAELEQLATQISAIHGHPRHA